MESGALLQCVVIAVTPSNEALFFGGPNDYGDMDLGPSNRWLLERRPAGKYDLRPGKRGTIFKRGK